MFLWYTAAAVFSAAHVLARNPLATNDQRELDLLSMALAKDSSFEPHKQEARTQYTNALKKYGMVMNKEMNEQLDQAMDELVFSSVQKAVNGDPTDPKVYWTDTAARPHDWFGLSVPGGRYSYDNPDCIYRIVPIDGKYSYKLKGRRFGNGTADSSFSLISNPNSQNTVSAIYGRNLEVNDDGSYEITISNKDSKSPNHIKSNFMAKQLFIRHNIGNWEKETPDELTVEVEGNPKPFFPRTNASIIWDAGENLKESAFFYGYGALDFKTLSQPRNNLLPPSISTTLGTLTSQAFSFTSFKLQDDEALVITLTTGKATYWVLPITTGGLLTVDPEHNIVSFNNYQSMQNNNGSYTFVISAQDPKIYNWLNITGVPQGTIMGRWQGLKPKDGSNNDINVWTSHVKFSELSNILPKETRYISDDERSQQLAERRRGYKRIHYQ
ncbi:hypothetical protein ACI68E_003995 [Malassezia pachydermatis]|uniref:DUF1214 domain-containing protein n=1 Tax=Malassezia pachydermatis TaxID=77020 RepID=A0A0M9VN05_9BASI|nr:hypothetical protein Malapachy_0581 [Malassezia pachydermatis]KOS12833.1 hypothetical protein Malapachy_0581 [Malassezia pachydermatis]